MATFKVRAGPASEAGIIDIEHEAGVEHEAGIERTRAVSHAWCCTSRGIRRMACKQKQKHSAARSCF